MKRGYPVEFVFQVVALILAAIVVHAVFVTVVRPKADVVLAEQTARMQIDPDYVPERSVWVIVRDFEQEACFVLMLWAMAIMTFKWVQTSRQNRLLQVELVPIGDGMRILPEDSREYARQIQALPEKQQRSLLPRALLSTLHRFIPSMTESGYRPYANRRPGQ